MDYEIAWAGLEKLSSSANGNEKLGVGIRPYGLHTGNLASVVAYPYLFLENFEAHHKRSAHFTFQVWLNDIEPVVNVGADGDPKSADWANMYPGSTSFQFTPAPGGFKGNLADYWQPAIEGVVRGAIGARFPDVTLEFHRASELVVTPEFEKTVVGCISKPDHVRHIINTWNRGVAYVQGPSSFVWPLCSECHEPLMYSESKRVWGKKLISAAHEITQHSIIRKKPVNQISWAVQFRMLQTARLAAIKPDIWFMGMDHVPTSMGGLLEDLTNLFGLDECNANFLHAPLLFAKGNKKLSKSLGNAVYMPIEELINALRGNPNVGLDVQFAPFSSDILSIGAGLLPDHIAGNNQKRRLTIIKKKKDAYERSDLPEAFRSANARKAVKNHTVGRMLGVPHTF